MGIFDLPFLQSVLVIALSTSTLLLVSSSSFPGLAWFSLALDIFW